jgi:hypothetical protein
MGKRPEFETRYAYRLCSAGMQIDICETSCNALQLVSMGGHYA